MGKIRVQDLARMMGIQTQDLVFKLKSIGVRVEGDDAHIDTDIIQAILQGKKLPHPREVILRDKDAPEEQATPAARRRRTMPPRRPANPLRPNRPRTLIQKVERDIKTLPATERREPEKKPEETPAAEAAEPAAKKKAPETAPSREERLEREEREREKAKKEKPSRRRDTARVEEEEELAAFRGDPRELEETEEPAEEAKPTVSRRSRRATRREAAEQRRDEESGRVLTFAKGRPEGPVIISEGMTVRDFADKLGVKSKDLIKALFGRGVLATINHVLEPELAEKVAADLGVEAMTVSFEKAVQLRQEASRGQARGAEAEAAEAEAVEAEAAGEAGKVPRAPVVTVMGHVDHGKTSLLDAIRETQVAAGEAGGITQHMGAYHVDVGDRSVVFLDTPGHEAFTLMRARGAQVTDLVVLVVAADDGVMPQTLEAIDHSRAADVPIIIAINKMDKANANPDRVKKELADIELLVEDWGGDTVAVPISALQKEGIDELLEMILLNADLLELKADPELAAHGAVVEARKEVGRGTVATVLVQNGTLEVGDVFVSGATWGRVRSMLDDAGERIEKAGPSTPVEVSGFSDLPGAGDVFQVVESESQARSIANYRAEEQRRRELAPTAGVVGLEGLFARIQAGEVKELPVVIKADVQGSLEVLKDTLEKASTEKVKVRVIHSAVGGITTNDVLLASASEAIVVGFNVRPERNASDLAEKEGVDIRLHTVIYELVDELRSAMAGLLEPIFQEVATGRAEVREIFKVPRAGTVAGCHVVDGVIPRNASVRLVRDSRVVYEGKIATLRRFKDDVSEVRQGFDCGIALERFQDVKPGDEIQAYVREEVAAEL